jgi:polyhydroxyalkanoate synthase
MPYRMHTQYLRSLFLHNDLSEGRYCVGGQPVSLADIRVPVFAVATLTDHVAPWRSVFKLHNLLRTQMDFLLTSGGHNVGVVSPPGEPGRHYQIRRHLPDQAAITPGNWRASVPVTQGSWWPEWVDWLGQRSGRDGVPPKFGPALSDAPGTYIYQH